MRPIEAARLVRRRECQSYQIHFAGQIHLEQSAELVVAESHHLIAAHSLAVVALAAVVVVRSLALAVVQTAEALVGLAAVLDCEHNQA